MATFNFSLKQKMATLLRIYKVFMNHMHEPMVVQDAVNNFKKTVVIMEFGHAKHEELHAQATETIARGTSSSECSSVEVRVLQNIALFKVMFQIANASQINVTFQLSGASLFSVASQLPNARLPRLASPARVEASISNIKCEAQESHFKSNKREARL